MTDFIFEYEFEEKLIHDTVKDAFQKISSSENVRKLLGKGEINEEVKNFLINQGLIGILSPKDSELGMNLQLSAIIVKEAGKRLVSFPITEHLLGTYLLKSINDSEADIFEAGEKLVTIGYNHQLTISEENGMLSVSGTVKAVPFLEHVDKLIVLLESEQAILIDSSLLQGSIVKTQDLTYPLYHITLSNLMIDGKSVKLANYNQKQFMQKADLLIAAELSGISQEVLDKTVEYAKERKQFGVPIGKFQAVKHMIADMYVYNESMDVSVRYGAWAIENEGEDHEIVSKIAKAYSLDAIIPTIENGIQVHGGVGVTWEHDLHLYLKRAYRLSFMSDTLYSERKIIVNHLYEKVLDKSKIVN